MNHTVHGRWTIQKAIHIAAPRETVFDVWSSYENFPRFMSHVEEARRFGDPRSHWVVKGPGGTRLEWESSITECIRPLVLAWRSEQNAAVQHAGIVPIRRQEASHKPTGGSARPAL